MKKYISLFIKMNTESPIITACCFVMIFMMAFILDSTIGIMAGNYYQYNLVADCREMFQYTLFSEKPDFSDYVEVEESEKNSAKNKQIALEQIKHEDGVKNIYTVSTSTYLESETNTNITMVLYDEKLLDCLKYSCLAGRLPKQENEIVLNAAARKTYSLNHEYLIEFEGEVKKVKVVGFLENDLIFYPNFTAAKDMEKGDNTDLGIADRREQAMNGEYTGISLQGDSWSNLDTFDTIFIHCNQKNKSKLMNDLDGKFGYSYDVSESLRYYYNNFCSISKQDSFYLLLALLILFIVGFCIHGVLHLYNQKKEFAIYYLCGCTWRHSIFLSMGRIFLLFITAVPLACLSLRIWQRLDTGLIGYVLKLTNEICIFLGMIGLYLICCIPVYVIFGRTDTYELFRKVEGL